MTQPRDKLEQGVSALLEPEGVSLSGIERLASGTQSAIELVSGNSSDGIAHAFVLKRFSPQYAYNSREAVRTEYEALSTFHRALDGANLGCKAPEPLGILENDLAYLMRYESGTPLSERVPERRQVAKVCVIIIRGLDCFHRSVGAIYGDFQPGNVLLSEGRIVFLDMTIPNPFYQNEQFRRLQYFFPATDIGYWIYTVSAQFLRAFAKDSWQALKQLDMARELVCEAAQFFAATDQAHFYADVRAVVAAHFQRLSRGSGKGWLLSVFGRSVAVSLLR